MEVWLTACRIREEVGVSRRGDDGMTLKSALASTRNRVPDGISLT